VAVLVSDTALLFTYLMVLLKVKAAPTFGAAAGQAT
jgi:hypothetical protein